jgi:cystathionine beta-lyase/cystathionine gamma-synthase
MAALEGAEDALAGASGMAVIMASLLSFAHNGDHIVSSDNIYHYADQFMRQDAQKFGIETSLVDITDLDAVRAAIQPNTTVLYAEFLSNPLIKVADIPALGALAAEAGLIFMVDNTFTSPYLFRPLEHGAHLSLHSATKYLAGHGDAIAGIVSGSREHIKAAHDTLVVLGSCISPFNSWLLLRGIKTLEMRMERHCANALELARFLERQPEVVKLNYAGLEAHPGHALVAELMDDRYGGMLSFEIAGGGDAAHRLADALQLCDHGVSLGDVSTLVWPNNAGLVRVSVGCETVADLIADFEQAFEATSGAPRYAGQLRK